MQDILVPVIAAAVGSAVGALVTVAVQRLFMRPPPPPESGVIADWGPPTPTDQTILGDKDEARESILLLGTSLSQIMGQDSKRYHEWLDGRVPELL